MLKLLPSLIETTKQMKIYLVVIVLLILNACNSLPTSMHHSKKDQSEQKDLTGLSDDELMEYELSQSGEKTKKANFDIEIHAVKSAKGILDEFLDLLNFRYIKNLSSTDLNQLILQVPKNIENLIAVEGYFNPSINIERIDRVGSVPLILIHIKAGPRTRVNNIELEFMGDIVFDNSPEIVAMRHELYESWPLNRTDFFTQERWSEAKKNLLKQLLSKYFINAKLVLSKAKVHPEKNKVDILVRFDSGKRFYIDKINIIGLHRYPEKWVNNLIQIKPLSPYNQQKILDAQDRLISSGYFESVYIIPDTTLNKKDQQNGMLADLDVQLREFKRKKIQTEIGVTTDNGPHFNVEYADNKIPYLNVKNNTKLELAKNKQKFEIGFATPINAKNWYWQLDNKLSKDDSVLDFIYSKSYEISLGRIQKSKRVERGVYLSRVQTWDKTDKGIESSSAVFLKYLLSLRYFDDYLAPHSGWATSIDLGGGFVTTDPHNVQPFLRTHLRWMSLVPITERLGRLFFNAGIGVVHSKDGVKVPTSELFYAGGTNTVRGYKYRSIGFTEDDGKKYPAKVMYNFSAEWQKPLPFGYGKLGWDGILFVDTANLSNSFRVQNTWQTGVGVGVRWASPVGSLQVSVARAVKKKRIRLHLSLGFVF